MPIEREEQGTPGWWLDHLGKKLHERRSGRVGNRRYSRDGVQPSDIRPGLDLLEQYRQGDPPLRADIHEGWSAPFRQFLRMGRMAVAPMLVSAPANRMGVRDFRTAAADDELGDLEARRLMRKNKLTLKLREVVEYMLGLGDGYTIVTPPDETRDWSLITAESPMECITEEDPATGLTIAGLKMFHDSVHGVDWAYLFLPGRVMVARTEAARATTLFRRTWRLSDKWEWDEEKFDDVPGNRVAMVRFRNKDGRSEIEVHLDALDRINDKLFNEWWIGKLQAHKQRALEMPDEAEDELAAVDGDEGRSDDLTPEDWNEIFTSAPDAMWKLPKGAKIWESSAADLRQLVDSIKAELQWLAAASHNPLHSITPDAANGSAEGASLQREEHVYKIEDRRDRAAGGLAETLAMAFEFQGDDERSDESAIEPIWGPIERFSLSERSDAAVKLKGILPTEIIYADILQYAVSDIIERIRPLRAQELLYTAAAGEPAAPAAPSAASLPTTGEPADG